MITKLGSKLGIAQLIRVRLRDFYSAYEPYFPGAFFASGFGFDVATLGRIDHWMTLLQQGIFLLLIGFILTIEARFQLRDQRLPDWMERHYGLWENVLHFLFGGLLSAYTIFYFKSASSFVSLAFMLILVALLVANEHSKFRKRGLPIKYILFSLCLASFFVYFIPIMVGRIGVLVFTLSIILSFFTLILFLRFTTPGWSISWTITQRLLIPSLIVQLVFSGAYYLGALPPVPLSVKEIGIYHYVKKKGESYRLHTQKPSWRFWEKGDQRFFSREGDKVYAFTRVFSPTEFKDQVFVRWSFKNAKGNWEKTDRIPMKIAGGRNEGYRGYTYKSHFTKGKWRIQIETADEREIGRLNFEVFEDSSTEDREFRVEKG